MELIKLSEVDDKIITLRNQKVILDRDLAVLYGVQTKRVNEAVKNNPDKFPPGYIFELSPKEKSEVVENFDHPTQMALSPTLPKAFTERGLYMLATILKSTQATQTTLAIVETFTKIRALSREVGELVKDHTNEGKQKSLMQKGSDILSEIIDADLETVGTETSFELNLLATVKIKHTVKRDKKSKAAE
ncbi:MAG: ORF6N domain-containing protein [Alistipes sp.]|jgi:hypothetical protein|nr:ORF6N domain-containing protein [Alistipes sp.]